MKSLPIILIILGCMLVASPSRGVDAASYVVDRLDDTTVTACTGSANDCTLRGALTNANAASSPGDVITFSPSVFFNGSGATIVLTSGLPLMSGGADTIDGTGGDVTIDGNGVDETQNFICFFVVSPGNTIKGLKITDCAVAILLQTGANNNTVGPGNVVFDNSIGIGAGDANGNTVIGNKAGTNPGGTAIHPDGGNNTGIEIDGDNNTIGGVNASDRNIVAGNNSGILITSTATNNVIRGNFIGTDATGTVDLGNTFNGIDVQAGGNTIGGTNTGEGNLISGNTSTNLRIVGEDADSNVVSGNIIGPDVNGSGAAMTGGATNVFILSGADNNTVGPGNVISDGGFGLVIQDATSTGNVVKGNKIGTNPAGTAAVPNTGSGVIVQGGASGNTIGGIAPGEGNIIAFNGFNGVLVQQSSVQNRIRSNSIHDNTDVEIDNVTGGNFELAPPVITAAGSNAVGGTACANCEVDVFSDGASDAEFFEGSATANGSGQWALYTSIVGPNVTATNTDTNGNTSELSAAVGFTALDTDGDGVPTSLDNCPTNVNPNQANADGDGAGDVCDSDDDNDSIPDGSDSCPTLAEDFDGFQDTDGCPDPDNDSDGICDSGQTNISCTGSDFGQDCFDPAATLSCTAHDCRNVAEDIDAFHDTDGCPEPDNDNDGFPDSTDDCPGTASQTGPDGMLGSPEDLNHNGVRDGGEATFTTDDVMPLLAWEDKDGVLDTDGCHDSPGDDFDGDGLTDDTEVFTTLTNAANPDTDADTVIDGTDNCPNWANAAQNLPPWPRPAGDYDCDGFPDAVATALKAAETTIGTDPVKHCTATSTANDEPPPDAWPPDFNDNQLVNGSDWVSFNPRFGARSDGTPGQGGFPYNARWDLNANGLINGADMLQLNPFMFNRCA